VIEDLEHVFAPQRLLGVRRTVSPLGSLNVIGKLDTLNLKPP